MWLKGRYRVALGKSADGVMLTAEAPLKPRCSADKRRHDRLVIRAGDFVVHCVVSAAAGYCSVTSKPTRRELIYLSLFQRRLKEMKQLIEIQFVFLALFLGAINTASGDAPILFSPHLTSYVDKVTEQTRRRLVVERRSLPLGLKAAFIPDPRFIKIVLDPSINLKTNYAEYSIAHEVTHGLLTYAKGYAPLIAKRPLTAKEQTRRSIAAVLVEDIVVNRILQTEGFAPFAPIYLATVQYETKVANAKGTYPHPDLANDEEGRDRWMVLRYIIAWGLVEYCSLDQKSEDVIGEYLRAFQNAYPKQFSMAEQVKSIIKENDIFEAQGYRKAMASILDLWKLNDFLQMAD